MHNTRKDNAVCNLCGSSKSKRLFTVRSFNIVQCSNCGLVYLNPMPCLADIAKIYDTSGYYCNREFQGDATFGYPDYRMLESHLAFVADEILRPIKYINPARLLDVGCSMGIMLKRFRELGWDTYGVDISTYATEYARNKLGLKVFTGLIDDLDFPENFFDLVTMVLTIEHLPDPKGTLHAINRLMKPGATLVVATHDISGLWPRIVRSKWRHLNIPEHLHFFSRSTLQHMMKETGFSPFRVTETATVAAATGDSSGLYAPINFLRRYSLLKYALPLLRSVHAINRAINLSDGITLYSQKL